MRAPVYDAQADVRPVSPPGPPRPVPGAFGEAVGEGLQGLAGGVAQVAGVQEQLKKEADVTQSQENENAVMRTGIDEYAKLKRLGGQPAIDYATTMMENITKKRDDLLKNNTFNPVQARMFRENSDRLILHYKQQSEEYTTTQIELRKRAGTAATINTSMQGILSNPSSDDNYNINLSRAQAAAKTETEQLIGPIGKGDKTADIAYEDAMRKTEGQAVATRLNALLNGPEKNVAKAMEFWQRPGVRESLGQQEGHYAGMVETAFRQQRVKDEGDRILADRNNLQVHDNPNIQVLSLTSLNEAVNRASQGRTFTEKEELRQYVMQGQADSLRAQDQTNTFFYHTALQAIENSGGDITAVTPEIQKYLLDPRNGGGDMWTRLTNVAREIRANQANAPPTPQQFALWGTLVADMAANWPQWATRTPEDIYKLYTGDGKNRGLTLSQAHDLVEKLAHTKQLARAEQGQLGATAHTIALQQYYYNQGERLNRDPRLWNEKQAIRFANLTTYLENMATIKLRGGDKPTDKDYVDWAKDYLKQGRIIGQGILSSPLMGISTDYQVSRMAYESDPDLQAKGPFISEEELATINKNLTAAGQPLTTQNQLDMYYQAHPPPAAPVVYKPPGAR